MGDFRPVCICSYYALQPRQPGAEIWKISDLGRTYTRHALSTAWSYFPLWLSQYLELPWFGEAPGYYNTHTGGMMPQYPQGGMPYGYPMQQQPMMQGGGGSTTIIQPGRNGQQPTITHVWTARNTTNERIPFGVQRLRISVDGWNLNNLTILEHITYTYISRFLLSMQCTCL